MEVRLVLIKSGRDSVCLPHLRIRSTADCAPDKLGAPINRWSNKIGSEAFWPTTLDKESDKAARILKTFCSMFCPPLDLEMLVR